MPIKYRKKQKDDLKKIWIRSNATKATVPSPAISTSKATVKDAQQEEQAARKERAKKRNESLNPKDVIADVVADFPDASDPQDAIIGSE